MIHIITSENRHLYGPQLWAMHEDIEKVLIAEEVIEKRLDVIAKKIHTDFASEPSLQVVAILKGALGGVLWGWHLAVFLQTLN